MVRLKSAGVTHASGPDLTGGHAGSIRRLAMTLKVAAGGNDDKMDDKVAHMAARELLPR